MWGYAFVSLQVAFFIASMLKNRHDGISPH